jgi:nitronate monooxygenase
MTLHTPLCDRLGIRVPVLLAPMAGGVTTPELAAAVTRAGGLGSLGVAGMDADAVRAAVGRAVQLCDGGPIAVNVLLAAAETRATDAGPIHDVLAPFREELGLEPPAPSDSPPSADPPLALVQAGLEAGARVVSVGIGNPEEVAPAARAAGAPLLAGAATVEEAVRWAQAGADAVVLQGAEAGGHRMTPTPGAETPPLVGTFVLVPQAADAVDVPVVAAGGVMDGRGLAAALALGAQGVAMGTRFLLAAESAVPPAVRERLLALSAADTVVTDRITGRPARWARSRLVEALAAGPEPLGWPVQRGVLADVRAAAARAGNAELFPMLSGQGAGLAARVMAAEEIVDEVVAGAREALSRACRPS